MKRRVFVIIAIAVLLLVSFGFGLRYRYHITKFYDNITSSSRTLWKFPTGLSIYYSSAAISTDGNTVYFGTSNGINDLPENGQALYSLDTLKGTLKWKYDLGTSEVRSAPALAPDGSIYFVVEQRDTHNSKTITNDKLYKLTPNGTFEWDYPINSSPSLEMGLSTPAIASDGTIYVTGKRLYAIRPDGSLKWEFTGGPQGDIRNSPAIGPDGTVYFGYVDYLYAVNPQDGTQKWSVNVPGSIFIVSSPAIASDGTIYIGNDSGIFYAVSPTGVIRWSYNVGDNRAIRSSPAIDGDGTIYFGTKVHPRTQTEFFALRPDGTLKWAFEPHDRDIKGEGNDIYSSPAIGSDGIIYFGCETAYVYALNPDGKLKWKYPVSKDIDWASPVIKSDGTIFIGDMAGDFYAIKSNSLGLKADSPWPKFHYDNQNDGRVSP